MVVRTRVGTRFCIWDLDELIQRAVFWTGEWEPPESGLLQRRLRPGQCFVDVGAQLGYHTLLASRLVGPEGRVMAIEPVPLNVSRLRRNIEINAVENVTAFTVAAADDRGRASFATRSAGGESAMGGFSATGDTTVPVQTLDSILADANAPTVDFLKIDVEGGEPEVLFGARELLASESFRGPIMIEINELRLAERGYAGTDIVEVFLGHGFRDTTLEAGLNSDFSAACHTRVFERR